MSLPLFEPRTSSFSPSIEARKQEAHPNVLHVYETIHGPFNEVRDGKTTGRTYQILHLTSGAFQRSFDDGTTSPLPAGYEQFVENAVGNGWMGEVVG